MKPGTKKQTKSEPVLLAAPPDPNRCFVHFSRVALTVGTAAVSLRSLLNQIEKHPAGREIKAIQIDPATLIMEVLFVEGGVLIAEHQGSAGRQ